MITSSSLNPLPDWSVGEVAIPSLNGNHLPIGIHDCTFEELNARFGFTKHRTEQLSKIADYLEALRRFGASGWVMVNGSFVTSKEQPGDIDIIVVMNRNAMSGQTAEDRIATFCLFDEETAAVFGLDSIPGYGDAPTKDGFVNEMKSVTEYIDYFTTIKETGEKKGILRIEL